MLRRTLATAEGVTHLRQHPAEHVRPLHVDGLHLASLGMDSRLIALHARWQSAVVLRYIAEAPLARLTD